MHWYQPAQGFEVQVLVTHDQIVTLDQRDTKVTRQVGMLEIGFVVRARRQ